MCRTSIYGIWCNMINRCENPNVPNFKNYGDRGIKVCERWRNSFEAFYADVGNKPEGMSLDRWPDKNGDYEPTNWRWATTQEQRINSRPKSYGLCNQRWFYGHGPSGEMIIENNQSHVARIFKLNRTSISTCLCGKCAYHKGWRFQWIPKQKGETR
ncbi:hypothetical protein KAW18_01045 [candidate division WOR-3 bacterium]|nr:hypothetical protein [candidate division WOR-3 bacterium]